MMVSTRPVELPRHYELPQRPRTTTQGECRYTTRTEGPASGSSGFVE